MACPCFVMTASKKNKWQVNNTTFSAELHASKFNIKIIFLAKSRKEPTNVLCLTRHLVFGPMECWKSGREGGRGGAWRDLTKFAKYPPWPAQCFTIIHNIHNIRNIHIISQYSKYSQYFRMIQNGHPCITRPAHPLQSFQNQPPPC